LFKRIYLSVVKEEVIDEDAHLPCFNGRVIAWVIIFNIILIKATINVSLLKVNIN
jgi:hypothetical protein